MRLVVFCCEKCYGAKCWFFALLVVRDVGIELVLIIDVEDDLVFFLPLSLEVGPGLDWAGWVGLGYLPIVP